MISVSVVVPAYNEAAIAAQNLRLLAMHLDTLRDRYDVELILVDDGSSDDTLKILRAFAREYPPAVVVPRECNGGLGAALRSGFAASHGDIVITLDIDLSYAPEHVKDLLRTAIIRQADVVVASAFMRGGKVRNVPWYRKLLSAWANRFLSLAMNGQLATVTCMVRGYNGQFIRSLETQATGMDVNVEIAFSAQSRRARIVEIPARLEWRQAEDGGSRLSGMRICRQITRVLKRGFSHRPLLWIAVPAIFPGLLPLVVAAFWLTRASAATIAIAATATVIIQYSSLALFSLLITQFGARRLAALRQPQGGTRPC